MSESEKQPELFTEFGSPKKGFPGISSMLPRADLDGRMTITIPLERAIIAAIGIIMVMVVVYALGVERGKALKKIAFQARTASPQRPIAAATPPASSAPAVALAPSVPAQARPPLPAAKKAPLAAPATKPALPVVSTKTTEPYTILVAAFRNKENALKEMLKLKQEGFTIFYSENNGLTSVYLGTYATREAALPVLAKIKPRYRDAQIRLR